MFSIFPFFHLFTSDLEIEKILQGLHPSGETRAHFHVPVEAGNSTFALFSRADRDVRFFSKFPNISYFPHFHHFPILFHFSHMRFENRGEKKFAPEWGNIE